MYRQPPVAGLLTGRIFSFFRTERADHSRVLTQNIFSLKLFFINLRPEKNNENQRIYGLYKR